MRLLLFSYHLAAQLAAQLAAATILLDGAQSSAVGPVLEDRMARLSLGGLPLRRFESRFEPLPHSAQTESTTRAERRSGRSRSSRVQGRGLLSRFSPPPGSWLWGQRVDALDDLSSIVSSSAQFSFGENEDEPPTFEDESPAFKDESPAFSLDGVADGEAGEESSKAEVLHVPCSAINRRRSYALTIAMHRAEVPPP